MRTYRLISGEAAARAEEDCFPFLAERGHVISIVGGGGKTTLMFYLAQQFAERGMKTAVMTTTKIRRTQRFERTIEGCRACWEEGTYAVCGQEAPEGKLCAPEDEVIAALLEEADTVLIEADGAKGMACKAPAAHEPVILPETDIVMGVVGVQVLNKTVEEACFRAECVCALLGCDGMHRLTAEDLAQILLSPAGTRKSAGRRTYYTVINQCDNETWLERGAEIARALESGKQQQTVLTCFRLDELCFSSAE